MVYQYIKSKLLDLYRHNIEPRAEALHAEQIYQGIFIQQCRAFGVNEVFYPVGAAASYSLMYLLTRVLTELPAHRVIELGSGQTTALIDRLRKSEGSHVAYDQSELWVNTVAGRVTRCSLQFSELTSSTFEGTAYQGYAKLQKTDFDLLLVDGPNGTAQNSRFDCIPLVAANQSNEFIVIIDDASRPGEQDTVRRLSQLLAKKGIDYKLNYLSGRTTQAVFTTPKFRAASYYF